MSLEETLKAIKPNLRPNTIKSYATSLRGVHKNTNIPPTPEDILTNKNILFKYLQSLDYKKRKHTISSILLLINNNADKTFLDTLRNIMLEDIKLTDEELKRQEKSPKQVQNWMSWNEVLTVRNNLEKVAEPLITKKVVNPLQYNKIIDYIIVCLYTYNPPRRLDYKDMRPYGFPQKDITPEDNYIDVKGQKFVFQNYKTKGSYDSQYVDIDPTLFHILKRFSKVKNPFEPSKEDSWLIYDSKGKKLNSSKLSQRLNSIFNRPNFSTNMLRHIYISEKVLPDRERLTKLEQTAEAMGHSVETQQLYKKF